MHRFLAGKLADLPHPGADWPAFLAKIKKLASEYPKVFCPHQARMQPWVDVAKLARLYGKENSASSACTLS